MNRPLLSQLLLFAAFLLTALQAHATHIIGGEISYTPFSNDPRRYYVMAKLYRDKSYGTADFSNEVSLYCRKSDCTSADPADFTTTLVRIETTPIGPSTERQVFTGEITLPLPGNWTLSLAEVNRTRGILNLSNSETFGMYVDAELRLDPTIGKPNTSPVFTSEMLPFICGNQFHRFSFATFDADGDSLVYRLITPQGATQQERCPRTIPVTASPHFVINPATGELSTGPFTLVQGYYIMAARVEEYRRVSGQWLKIGSVMRDMMYRTLSSSNHNPEFSGLVVGNTSQSLDQTIRANPGQKLELKLAAADQDAGSALRFSSEATTSLPGVSLQTLPNNQSLLTWQVPPTLPLGRYRIPVAVTDNGYPISGTEVRTLTIFVTSQILSTTSARLPALVAAYPTPFRDQVSFQLSQKGSQSLTVLDGLGRTVAHLTSRPDGSVTWQPAATLSPGLYVARSADGQQVRLLRE